jgi:hypothetical protein
MDTVTILRELWRKRVLVAGICVVAVIVGAALHYRLPSLQSRRYDVGVATMNILVDTPSSQVVNVAPKGSDATGARATLLASLMVGGEIKSMIANRVGINANQLIGTTSAVTDPATAGVGASTGTTPTIPANGYSYNTQVPTDSVGDELPIIQLNTQAPTAAEAANLASAAVAELQQFMNTKAVSEGITDANRLRVSGMGVPAATIQAKGASPMVVLLVMVVVFLIGCAAILGVQAVVRGWRHAAELEKELEDSESEPDAPAFADDLFAEPDDLDEVFLDLPAAGVATNPERGDTLPSGAEGRRIKSHPFRRALHAER